MFEIQFRLFTGGENNWTNGNKVGKLSWESEVGGEERETYYLCRLDRIL